MLAKVASKLSADPLTVFSCAPYEFFATPITLFSVETTVFENALLESEEKYRTLFEKSKRPALLIHDNKYVDCNKAAELFTKAANMGYAKSEYNLACCYLNGHGVKKDKTLAFYWYTKAAGHGDVNAQYSLGYCYENGIGFCLDG